MIVPIIIPIPGKASAFTHGVLWKGVRCERCGCEYVYRVARSGEASQHFYGGGVSAVAGASDAARHDLQAQLWSAVEPAPCPDCGWLQADMIHAARVQRYPRVAAKSWVWSLVGAGAGGLVLAPVVFGGETPWVPGANTHAGAWEIAILVICAAIALVPAGVGIYRWRRRARFNPNEPADATGRPAPPVRAPQVMRRDEYIAWAQAQVAQARPPYGSRGL